LQIITTISCTIKKSGQNSSRAKAAMTKTIHLATVASQEKDLR
jgi:hypothetical protein